MLIRLDFLKLETDHLVFFLGAGAGFFHQLKPDIFRDFSESIYFFNHKVIFTITNSAYTLEHQLSIYHISNLQKFL